MFACTKSFDTFSRVSKKCLEIREMKRVVDKGWLIMYTVNRIGTEIEAEKGANIGTRMDRTVGNAREWEIRNIAVGK